MAKKILCIGLLVMMSVFVIGCGPKGGTIVIENEYDSPEWGVAIGSSSSRPGEVILQPGQKYEKSFDADGTYYAFGNFTTGWRVKTVSLSGGETVVLRGEDF